MNYTITGTDNEFQNGVQVKNAIESDIPLLDKTFETLIPNETLLTVNKLISAEYEMCLSYNIRMLKQICRYQAEDKKDIRIVTKYYSTIKSKFIEPNVFFVGLDNGFKILHILDVKMYYNEHLDVGSYLQAYPKFTSTGEEYNVVIERNSYEAMIKDALIAIRFGDYL